MEALGAIDIKVTSLGNKNGKDQLLVDEGVVVLVIAEMDRIMQRKDMRKEVLFEYVSLEVEDDEMVDFDELEGFMLPSNNQ